MKALLASLFACVALVSLVAPRSITLTGTAPRDNPVVIDELIAVSGTSGTMGQWSYPTSTEGALIMRFSPCRIGDTTFTLMVNGVAQIVDAIHTVDMNEYDMMRVKMSPVPSDAKPCQ